MPVGEASSAAPVGKDGKIYACTGQGQAEGRDADRSRPASSLPQGGAKGRLEHSDRDGPGGRRGPGAASGTGEGANEAALKAQVGALSLRVQTFEGVLQGITNTDLKGVLATLQGVNNEELKAAIQSLPRWSRSANRAKL